MAQGLKRRGLSAFGKTHILKDYQKYSELAAYMERR